MNEVTLAVFDTNAIHGYNPQYRDYGGNGRFDAFDMHDIHPRPVRFHNELVPGTQLLDHQGHIVPQGNYTPRLMTIAAQVDHDLQNGHGPYNLANANARLVHHHPGMNFQVVTTYIQNRLMAAGGAPEAIFVDGNGADVEERLGGYFSVINWNPANICRAPGDNHRNGYPGNGPDNAVALKLLIDPNNPGIVLDPNFGGFLEANIANLLANVDDFITSCNACLAVTPMGYYKFDWDNLLTPVI
ncbi:hypothetical protein [Aquibium oceanicum]|nr:hypothetical protein [Aquibium oceanicum]